MTGSPHRTTRHELGFRRLDPLPDAESLRAFYGDDYGELDSVSRREPDLTRLQATDNSGDRERLWLEQTLYTDVRHHLGELGHVDGTLLDVGCGTGDFLVSMREAGWAVSGTELSKDATRLCEDRGLQVTRSELQTYAAAAIRSEPQGNIDIVTLFNVLEHVVDPIGDLQAAHQLLRPGGCLVVQVPNDFSVIQLAAAEANGLDPWWVAVPDHLNYFDYESLEATLRHTGFTPVIRTGTFPMELFLLLGEDYISAPELGGTAHETRRKLEMALAPDTRRALANRFAAGSIGRNCIVLATR